VAVPVESSGKGKKNKKRSRDAAPGGYLGGVGLWHLCAFIHVLFAWSQVFILGAMPTGLIVVQLLWCGRAQ
jgi:hypothetical protein